MTKPSWALGFSPSRFCPCALLVLHLHQVAQGTFTPKLSDMSDTQPCRVAAERGQS